MKSIQIILYLLMSNFDGIFSLIGFSYLKTMIGNLVEDKTPAASNVILPKAICDENQLMLHLAKMCAVSPERVLLLLTTDPLSDACEDLADTLNQVNKTQMECTPLSTDNLYMKLWKTMQFFYVNVCQEASHLSKELNKFRKCLPELREEFFDCEGPQDWYENANQSKRCRIFSDIVNCNYLKAATLCGLKPGAIIRGFAVDLFQNAQPVESKCEVSSSLPKIDDAISSSPNPTNIYLVVNSISYIYVFIKTFS